MDWYIESSYEGPLNWLWQIRLSLVNGVILQHHGCMTMTQFFFYFFYFLICLNFFFELERKVIRSSRTRQYIFRSEG